jgi:hypothetical protein
VCLYTIVLKPLTMSRKVSGLCGVWILHFLMLLFEMFMSRAYLILVMDVRHMKDFIQDILREVTCINIMFHILETGNLQWGTIFKIWSVKRWVGYVDGSKNSWKNDWIATHIIQNFQNTTRTLFGSCVYVPSEAPVKSRELHRTKFCFRHVYKKSFFQTLRICRLPGKETCK